MTDLDARCLEAFPNWLKTLSDDARLLAERLDGDTLPVSARTRLAGALNYLFKSLDLIPDGIEDLWFLDDAFVFRATAAVTLAADGVEIDDPELQRLKEEAELVREFLGPTYDRLISYVERLADGTVRGRSAGQIASDAEVRAEFLSEVRGFADSYAVPSFARDPKSLVKLRSFLTTKL